MAKPLAKLVAMITPKRRWAQFSLATMFVVMTALCVWLGAVVDRAHRQRDAVAAIEDLGGRVYYVAPDQDEAIPRRFLRRWLPRDFFDEVRSVNLLDTQVTDLDLAHLLGLTGLQEIHLDDTQVTDAGLAHVQRLMRLEWLSVTGTRVTDAGLTHLQGLTRLKAIWINRTEVTDAGLAQLRQALPNCLMFEPDPRR